MIIAHAVGLTQGGEEVVHVSFHGHAFVKERLGPGVLTIDKIATLAVVIHIA